MTRWTWIALLGNVHYWRLFVHSCTQQQWTWPALMVGVLHMLIGALTLAVPLRALSDPEFPGYQLGALYFEKQAAAAPATLILIWALTTACLVVRRGTSQALRRLALIDLGFAALLCLLFFESWWCGELRAMSFRLGEGLTITGTAAAALPVLLDILLFGLSALWVLHFSRTQSNPFSLKNIISSQPK